MISSRKKKIEKISDSLALKRNQWIKRNSYFYNDDYSYMKFLVGEQKRVIELGCGTGQLLNSLNPSFSVGYNTPTN